MSVRRSNGSSRAGTPRPDYYAGIRGGSRVHRAAEDLRPLGRNRDGRQNRNGDVPPDGAGRRVPATGSRSRSGRSFRPARRYRRMVSDPVPATGPYVIRPRVGEPASARSQPRTSASGIAVARGPTAIADEIVVTLGFAERQPTTVDVAQGRADVANGFVAFSPRVADFETQHPAQVHTTPAPTTFFWYLNTTRASVRRRPCAPGRQLRPRPRRAAYGIVGGPEAAQPTCQVLPPNFPGYRPYCPYTANAGAGGAWSAPDLAKARELVRESGTGGRARRVLDAFERAERRGRRTFRAETFTQLGYRFSVRRLR